MLLDEYWNQVLKTYKANPNWRYGQAAFNVLYEVRPDLSEKVQGDTDSETGKDPFHLQTTNCPNWHNYVAFLKENW